MCESLAGMCTVVVWMRLVAQCVIIVICWWPVVECSVVIWFGLVVLSAVAAVVCLTNQFATAAARGLRLSLELETHLLQILVA